jgi:hypothetical protein
LQGDILVDDHIFDIGSRRNHNGGAGSRSVHETLNKLSLHLRSCHKSEGKKDGIDVHKNDSIKGFGVRDETTSGTLENLGMPDKSLKEVD